MELTKTHGYGHGLMVLTTPMVLTKTHGIVLLGARTHGLDRNHGIDNTHGICLESWYIIGAPESLTYTRVAGCPYAGFEHVIFKCSKVQVEPEFRVTT